MPRNLGRRALATVAFLVLAACNGDRGAAQAQRSDAPPAIREQIRDTATPGQQSQAQALSATFRSASSHVLPAVVYIQVEKKASSEAQQQQIPEQFRRFFGLPPGGGDDGEGAPVGGAGSGFIFDREGHIVTNNHVVADTDQVLVRMVDGREYTAKVVGTDEMTDVAVLKIDPKNGEQLPTTELGNSDSLQVGDWVLALGSPLELQFTVTAGIVSAKGRQLTGNPSNLEAFIQTDAAINPGNSGGPLVDLDGKVVGINTAIYGSDRFVGYGFAIPVNIVRKTVGDILQYGHVRRPQLGVQIQSVSEADAEVYKLPSIAGAEVVVVQKDSPAEKAGIKLGDVVVAVDGDPIKDGTDLTTTLARHQPGERVTLTLYRKGQKQDVAVTLGEFEHGEEATKRQPVRKAAEETLGFRVEPLTADLARELEIDRTSGVVISNVTPLSGAFAGGVQPRMVLLEINGQPVKTVADVDRIAGTIQLGQVVSLRVLSPQSGDELIINYRARR
ncbi:MAG TPA: Do family serine endopeptidase [Thermoanaerobaculia bacterium]|jgi:serine protease Do|nr:Do family serine endopeptidase [Thermoanaerobaculia bacterium]